VFSPYYAWSGRKVPADHCAINVALYGKPARWSMTERGARAISRTPHLYRIGPSAISWDDGVLVLRIAERGAPLPYAVRGEIRLTPAMTPSMAFPLDPGRRHWWQPVAPVARIAVRMTSPRLAWEGDAYHDANWGDEPLEAGFRTWTWSRAHDRAGASILYDADRRGGGATALACRFEQDGTMNRIEAPRMHPLPPTLWRVARPIRSESAPRLLATLEDTPFYVRSLASTSLDGRPVRTFHESLSLDRFAAPWVRMLLPFRMPRRFF